jgi:hypothetical protein
MKFGIFMRQRRENCSLFPYQPIERALVRRSVGPGFEFADFSFVSDMPGHGDHFTGTMRPPRELL